MTSQNVLLVVVSVAALVWVMYRQTTWQPVVPRRMWTLPAVMAGLGTYLLVTSPPALTGIDVGVIVLEMVIAVGTGAGMGAVARFRPVAERTLQRLAASRRPPEEPVTTESRTGWWGLALWVVAIVVRVGIGFAAHLMGADLAGSAGIIYLAFAANRVTRVAVLLTRYGRLAVTAADEPVRSTSGALGV